MENLISMSIFFVFNLLAVNSCKCEIPGLPHFSQEQKSILADERILKNIGYERVVFVPICGQCHNPVASFDVPITNGQNCNSNLANANEQVHHLVGTSTNNENHIIQEAIHHNNHNYDKSPNVPIHYYHPHQALNHDAKATVTQAFLDYTDHNKHHDSDELHHKKDHNVHYKFEYSVNDHKSGDIKQHREERKGDAVSGEYSLVEEDGNVRTVKYYADWKTGFHAQVHNSKRNHY